MITISEAHYHKLVETVQILHKNIGFYTPTQLNIEEIYQKWSQITQGLNSLYQKLNTDLESILETNSSLKRQNKQLNDQKDKLKTQNSELLKTNTMQRSQLAKNQADYNKLKEIAKAIKNSLKDKDEIIKEQKEIMEQLGDKAKKYKKMYQQQMKKVQKLDKIVTVLEVTQKSSAKQKELDQEMEFLQAELQNLEQNQEEQ